MAWGEAPKIVTALHALKLTTASQYLSVLTVHQSLLGDGSKLSGFLRRCLLPSKLIYVKSRFQLTLPED
jgi:hypothetical protein